MEIFIIGFFSGIMIQSLVHYIISKNEDIRIIKEFGSGYVHIIMSKSEIEKYEKYINEQHIQD